MNEKTNEECIFCQIKDGKVPARIVYDDDKVMAILDINPGSKGHMLLMPKEHYAVLPMVDDETQERLFIVTKHLANASLKALGAKGATILAGNGVVAGQRAPHCLIHIIPRYDKDNLGLKIKESTVNLEKLYKLKDMLIPFIAKIKQGNNINNPKTKEIKKDSRKVAKVGINKEDGYLYYVDKEGDISKAPMKRGGNKKVKKEKPINLDLVSEMFK